MNSHTGAGPSQEIRGPDQDRQRPRHHQLRHRRERQQAAAHRHGQLSTGEGRAVERDQAPHRVGRRTGGRHQGGQHRPARPVHGEGRRLAVQDRPLHLRRRQRVPEDLRRQPRHPQDARRDPPGPDPEDPARLDRRVSGVHARARRSPGPSLYASPCSASRDPASRNSLAGACRVRASTPSSGNARRAAAGRRQVAAPPPGALARAIPALLGSPNDTAAQGAHCRPAPGRAWRCLRPRSTCVTLALRVIGRAPSSVARAACSSVSSGADAGFRLAYCAAVR